MQQIFAFTMVNVQQPTVVKGFGNIELSRETFEKVSGHFKASFIFFFFHNLLP